MFTVIEHMESQGKADLGERFDLVLQQDPRGSTSDADYDGGRFGAHGIPRDKVIRYLKRIAERLEAGENISHFTLP